MSVYNFKDVEAKWQHKWEETNQYKTDTRDTSKPLYYTLEMFPYPSGKIHMGHVRNYSIGDVVARFKKMEGYNVLHPMGWDSFGLPAENAAIKHGIHPAKWTYENIDDMKNQLKLLGLSYDWEREIATSNPDYYKFTQEIFLKFLEAGLAYKKKSFVNWCPSCETVLANEQVVGGQCERCDAVVVKKELEQWYFKTTEFAEELLNDLDKLEGWPEKVKTMQRNWIGKSHGAEIVFDIDGSDDQMIVYTTRPDTVYGTTFMALAPENPLVKELVAGTEYEADVDKFVQKMHTQTEIERTSTDTEKEGMFIGKHVINPITGRKVPLWIANYILMDYGTGAIMGVPAHDERDKEFATKYGIEIIDVIDEDGKMINSEEFNGMDATEAQDKITEKLAKEGRGKKTVNYRLRDWLLSRQRYWGVPIPVVYCEDCGIVPVDKKDLPVLLPTDVEFTGKGESPLTTSKTFINTTCPKCGGHAKRETDTMPNWAGSCWYFLRYMDAHNDKEFVSMDKMKYWGQVDLYDGGMEHATRHLLYARFWNIFLHEQGLVPYSEPFYKRIAHGMILASDGSKMSKSKGNVVNPTEMVEKYGADALRLYEMFIGDYSKDAAWNEDSLNGCAKFLDRVYNLGETIIDEDIISKENEKIINKGIKKVSEDIENLKYNTAVSTLMTMLNEFNANKKITKKEYRIFLQLLNPFAPHITEELNEKYNLGEELSKSLLEDYDESKIIDETFTMVVQVNGKVRGKIEVNANTSDDEMKELAKSIENVKNYIDGKEIIKEVIVPKKLVSIVVK